jgi:hypothetical protein
VLLTTPASQLAPISAQLLRRCDILKRQFNITALRARIRLASKSPDRLPHLSKLQSLTLR